MPPVAAMPPAPVMRAIIVRIAVTVIRVAVDADTDRSDKRHIHPDKLRVRRCRGHHAAKTNHRRGGDRQPPPPTRVTNTFHRTSPFTSRDPRPPSAARRESSLVQHPEVDIAPIPYHLRRATGDEAISRGRGQGGSRLLRGARNDNKS